MNPSKKKGVILQKSDTRKQITKKRISTAFTILMCILKNKGDYG